MGKGNRARTFLIGGTYVVLPVLLVPFLLHEFLQIIYSNLFGGASLAWLYIGRHSYTMSVNLY